MFSETAPTRRRRWSRGWSCDHTWQTLCLFCTDMQLNKVSEEVMHSLTRLCRRLSVLDAILFRKTHSNGFGEGSFGLEVCLVSNEHHLRRRRVRLPLKVQKVILGPVKAVTIGDVVDDDGRVGATVVKRNESAETFLASCVPNLKHYLCS
eukprot:TRINITY_DN901_c0_g1_i1.p1 TRINITY_DN901_c0_g1~~TRINITY_DN901_c0_g1_i1.p1  ORF type:complete len:150 (-),score=2.67 TRINITY_DN901_c0_g1_i1:243-692(-)